MSYLIDAAHAIGTPAGSEGQQSNPILGFLPIILMFVVLYLLMIRPQMKKQKNQQRLIDELEKGDEIVTNGGIHGSIQNIKDDILVIWTDYFKPEHLGANPDLHTQVWEACKLGSHVKQHVDMAKAVEFKAALEKIGQAFADSKK